MIRIVALNDDSDSNESNDDLITVTKEAEETIAASEYIRALELKAKGRIENALTLMRELLETRVLNEISLDDKNDKLLCIRYNCHKNIALILETQGKDEEALEHFLHAMEFDDTEVYTMHRFGQLALKLKEYNLAQIAFQKCLNRNPNHWPSADGILQVLCGTENIMGAYGWALKWSMKDESYERAISVLIEISEKFTDMVPFFECVWKHKFKRPDGRTSNGKQSMFPEPSKEIIIEDNSLLKPNLDEFRIECLNWLTVGQFIISVYEHMEETKQSIIFILNIDNLLKEKKMDNYSDLPETYIDQNMEQIIVNSTENPKSNVEDENILNENQFEDGDDNLVFITPTTYVGSKTPQHMDSNAEDSDNTKGEIEIIKPKVRRRCSDLSFLEQWGWHKNRRYSSRKKSQQDRPENDTTLNGFLRRIFAKHFIMSFDNESPFLLETKHESDSISKQGDFKSRIQHNQTTFEEFQSKTKDDFDDFIAELKAQNVDLILIIFVWLKYTSKYWLQPITEDMKNIYYKLYNLYINHYDLATWNQLSNDDFNASYRMTLFYLELDHEKALLNSDELAKDLSGQWKMLFHHLKFHSGCAYVISDEYYERNMIRLIHLEYCWAKFENQLNRSVDCLLHLESLLSYQEGNFLLELPNLKDFNFVDLSSVRNTRIDLQRKISLSNVKTLYENYQYQELVVILKDSLIYSTEVKNSDNTSMKIHTQFEVLLESLWNLEKYTECLIWSERCLKHAVDNLIVAPTDTYRYEEWASCVNYILIYIEELILKDGYEIISCLSKYQSRLVQNLIRLLVHQFDSPFDKNYNPSHLVNIKRPWVILHQCLQRGEDNSPVVVKTKSLDISETDDIEELLPHSILTLFTAHEFLGRRQWCTRDNGQLLLYILDVILPKLRAPYMDAYRDIISEYLEQITYCLYGYPPKKARSRHIEEHDAAPVELNWKRAVQLFDLYRPENLPEFNSYKLESISADMEQLLVKIIHLIPKEIDPTALSANIRSFISGSIETLPQECNLLPHHISCIYYLLADYYFKNRDFTRTNKYYILDLTCKPNRYDSWAGIALSKASKLETKLNSFTAFDTNEFTKECDQATRCFEQCIKLNKEQALIWIEYGSFTYFIHSYYSRDLKHSSDTLSMEQFAAVEERKDKHLSVAYNCFSISDNKYKAELHDEEDDDIEAHDEKWLNQYMLGKIAEKRKEHPKIYLDHYLLAANYLYENNATYPIKINHSNPTTLSVEALEMFYRTNAAIIKYIEQHNEIPRDIGNYFVQVLKSLAASPFAFNKAKVDDNSLNALKRKIADKAENIKFKQAKLDNIEDQGSIEMEVVEKLNDDSPNQLISSITSESQSNDEKNINTSRSTTPVISESCKPSSSRRVSQESSVTTTTSSTAETASTTSSSSGSGSSSSDSSSSDSDSSSDESEKPDENTPFTDSELEAIYKNCARNLEECVTRFPEHYKSVYRLVHHYLNGPEKLRDTTKCVQLLMGTYRTTLGNQINGLFFDRKNNNFFNGIWRIPSSEIDRPGSFSTHMVKCVSILSEVLRKTDNHKLLIEVALQLHRNPDSDKRYIKDYERLELYAQANSFCIQVMRDILKRNTENRNDKELLNLLIDIYKTHKKCLKHMNQKDPVFTQLLADVYKVYIQNKVTRMPENGNIQDLAIRLCLQEIATRKNQEKMSLPQSSTQVAPNIPGVSDYLKPIPVTLSSTNTSTTSTKPNQVAGGTARPRGRPVGSKNSIPLPTNSTPTFTNNFGSTLLDPASLAVYMSLFNNQKGLPTKNPFEFQNLVAEYYKLLGVGTSSGMASVQPNSAASPLGQIANPTKSVAATKQASSTSQPSNTQISTSNSNATMSSSASSTKIPQFDIKNLIASAASQASKFPNTLSSQSTTINIGSGELTITPTSSKLLPKDNHSGNTIKNPLTIANLKPSSSSASISLTKVPSNSPNISVKPLSDLTGKPSSSFSQRSQLPELPKSLTITPASQSYYNEKYKAKQPSQNAAPSELNRPSSEKHNLKAKSSSKKSQNSSPYARPLSRSSELPPNIGSASTIAGAQLNPLSSLGQYSMIPGFNLENYNQQANILARYADLLKSVGSNTGNPALLAQMSQMAQYSQFQMLSQKRPYNKKSKQAKNASKSVSQKVPAQTNISSNRSSMPAHSTSGPSNYSNFGKPPFAQPFAMPPSLSNHSSHISPNLSIPLPNHFSHPNISPSPGTHTSPTKTLQQKLAEKQKATQLYEKNSGAAGSNGSNNSNNGGKRSSIDVIILD